MGKFKVIYERYRIYNNGTVYDELKSKFIKSYINKGGYLIFNLYVNNKHKSHYAHRLVAECFINNRNNKRTVNHIDGNKLNNDVSNLEWNTHKENIIHAFATKIRNNEHSKRKIKDLYTGDIFLGVKSVSEKFGISKYSLYKSLSGDRNNNKRFVYE
jgi:hypothetical protein